MDFSKLIILQHTHISKHHDVHLKLVQCYMFIVFQCSWNKPKLTLPSRVWQGTAVLLGTWTGSFREGNPQALSRRWSGRLTLGSDRELWESFPYLTLSTHHLLGLCHLQFLMLSNLLTF